MADSDQQLVRQFVEAGDPAAFATLVERHRPRLRRLLWTLFNGNNDDVDDAEQEILLALYTDLGRFRHEAAFSTYLYRYARNKAIDMLRKHARARRRALAFANQPQPMVDPEEEAAAHHDEELALAAVMALPRADRELILMQESERMSIQEISRVSGLRPGTIKSRLHRLRKRLADDLRQLGVEV